MKCVYKHTAHVGSGAEGVPVEALVGLFETSVLESTQALLRFTCVLYRCSPLDALSSSKRFPV